jgi:hypothetical protein
MVSDGDDWANGAIGWTSEGWLLLALLFTAIALALPITRGSSGRAIKGKADLPSWLSAYDHVVSCYISPFPLTTIISSLNSLQSSLPSDVKTRIHDRMQSGATEEDNNASTNIHIPDRQPDGQPHPTPMQH